MSTGGLHGHSQGPVACSHTVFNFKDKGVKYFLRRTDIFINKASFFCRGKLHVVLVSAALLYSDN